MAVKPRFRVGIDGRNPRIQVDNAFVPWGPMGSASSFEAAGNGRRLVNFQPSQSHINVAIQQAGRTLVKRGRFLVENNGYAGNAVDVWAAWVIGEGIIPRPSVKDATKKAALRKLWKRWVKEADAEGQTNFYGLQEKIEREAYVAGECFVRLRTRYAKDMKSVPLQLQILPSEMLDLAYHDDMPGGNVIRMGIEFDKIGRRVAYHFWRNHPDDLETRFEADGRQRTRVPAEDVLHIFDGRQGGQIRGVSKFSRAMVKLFMLDVYDDAELDRKKVAALYAGFVTKVGERSPLDNEEVDDNGFVPLSPGAMVVLNEGEDVTFSSPADVGGSYEPFQYRTLLQVCAALGIPYAYMTGDTTKGNFSNVRTEIVNFRRRVGQRQKNVTIPQLCERVWSRWLATAEAAGLYVIEGDEDDADWLPPASEWVDPKVDVAAERDAVRSGFKTRSQVVAGLGYDREEIDEELIAENKSADDNGLILDTDPRRISAAGMSNAMPPGSGFPDADDEILDPADSNDSSVVDAGGKA